MVKGWLNYVATSFRSYSSIGLLFLVCAFVFVGFLGTPRQSKSAFEAAYSENFRSLGLTPVFPPREEFQTGDVFYIEYDNDQDNPNLLVHEAERTWLGTPRTRPPARGSGTERISLPLLGNLYQSSQSLRFLGV